MTVSECYMGIPLFSIGSRSRIEVNNEARVIYPKNYEHPSVYPRPDQKICAGNKFKGSAELKSAKNFVSLLEIILSVNEQILVSGYNTD